MFASPRRSKGCFRLLVWLVCMTSITSAQVPPNGSRRPNPGPRPNNGLRPICPARWNPQSRALPPAPSFNTPRVCGIDVEPSVPGGVHVGALLRMHASYNPVAGVCPRKSFLGWVAVQQILVSLADMNR